MSQVPLVNKSAAVYGPFLALLPSQDGGMVNVLLEYVPGIRMLSSTLRSV